MDGLDPTFNLPLVVWVGGLGGLVVWVVWVVWWFVYPLQARKGNPWEEESSETTPTHPWETLILGKPPN